MSKFYETRGPAGILIGPCWTIEGALWFARQLFEIDTLEIDDPEPRRSQDEPSRWQIYDDASDGSGEFLEREIYIVETEK